MNNCTQFYRVTLLTPEAEFALWVRQDGKPRSDLRIIAHQADVMRKGRRDLNLPAPYS